MITRVKNSSFSFEETGNFVSLLDPQIGAIGDGVTDNTAAITFALTLGLPIFIPPGTFLTGGLVLPAGAILFGTGNASKLKLKTASNVAFLQCSGAAELFTMYLDANKAGQLGSNLHAVIVTNGVGVTIDNVKIVNPLGDGINITGASTNGINISKTFISGAVKNAITIEAGIDISLNQVKCFSSDSVASPGDGISLAPTSAGSLVSEVSIINCTSRSNTGRGISILGNGGRNVTDINVVGGSYSYNGSHGIHAFTAQCITITGCNIKNNTGDGTRIEGDVQYSRVSECIFNANTATCAREVATGTSPNFNGFIYNAALGNGSNTTVKTGGSSFIV